MAPRRASTTGASTSCLSAPRAGAASCARCPSLQGDPRRGAVGLVLRAREVRITADRPFTVYADGDPIGELPVVVGVRPAAVRVLLPA
jgi:hypothetical protein